MARIPDEVLPYDLKCICSHLEIHHMFEMVLRPRNQCSQCAGPGQETCIGFRNPLDPNGIQQCLDCGCDTLVHGARGCYGEQCACRIRYKDVGNSRRLAVATTRIKRAAQEGNHV